MATTKTQMIIEGVTNKNTLLAVVGKITLTRLFRNSEIASLMIKEA